MPSRPERALCLGAAVLAPLALAHPGHAGGHDWLGGLLLSAGLLAVATLGIVAGAAVTGLRASRARRAARRSASPAGHAR